MSCECVMCLLYFKYSDSELLWGWVMESHVRLVEVIQIELSTILRHCKNLHYVTILRNRRKHLASNRYIMCIESNPFKNYFEPCHVLTCLYEVDYPECVALGWGIKLKGLVMCAWPRGIQPGKVKWDWNSFLLLCVNWVQFH